MLSQATSLTCCFTPAEKLPDALSSKHEVFAYLETPFLGNWSHLGLRLSGCKHSFPQSNEETFWFLPMTPLMPSLFSPDISTSRAHQSATLTCMHCSVYQRGPFLQLLPQENQTGFFLPINSAAELARGVDTEQCNTYPPLQNRSVQMLDHAIHSHQQTTVHMRRPLISGNSLLQICALQYEWMVQQEDWKSKRKGYKQFKSLSPPLWYLVFLCTVFLLPSPNGLFTSSLKDLAALRKTVTWPLLSQIKRNSALILPAAAPMRKGKIKPDPIS